MDININISKTHVFADTFFKKKASNASPAAGTLVFHFAPASLLVALVDGGAEPRIKSFLRLDTDTARPDPERAKAVSDYLASLGMRAAARVVAVTSEGIAFRQLVMPSMPDADLKQAAAWELKKKFFVNPDEQLIGILGVYESEGPEGPEKLVNVFHAEKKTALARLSILSSIGLPIHAFWPGPSALARAAAGQAGNDEADFLVVDVGGAQARITAVQQGMTMLSRVVQTGAAGPALPDTAFEKLAGEIQRSIEFYETQKSARAVSRIVLAGSGYDAAALAAHLSSKLTVKVLTLDGSKMASDALSDEQRALVISQPGLFAEAAGAVIVREHTLDLLPEEIHAYNRRRRTDQSLRKVFLAVASALAFWVVWVGIQGQIISYSLKNADREWKEIQTGKSAFTQIMMQEKQRAAAMRGAIDVPSLLKELSRLTPSPIVLDSFRYSRDEGSFKLGGLVQDAGNEHVKLVTQYVANLSASPFFKSVTLGQTMEEGGQGQVRFQVDAAVKAVS